MKSRVLIALLLLILIAVAAGASRHRSSQAAQGQAGVFDYYLLTLSWSPEFCHSPAHAEKPECQSGHNGFVLHGLWPQYAQGYPEHCSNAPGLANPGEMGTLCRTRG
jgi:ribonuclease T2